MDENGIVGGVEDGAIARLGALALREQRLERVRFLHALAPGQVALDGMGHVSRHDHPIRVAVLAAGGDVYGADDAALRVVDRGGGTRGPVPSAAVVVALQHSDRLVRCDGRARAVGAHRRLGPIVAGEQPTLADLGFGHVPGGMENDSISVRQIHDVRDCGHRRGQPLQVRGSRRQQPGVVAQSLLQLRVTHTAELRLLTIDARRVAALPRVQEHRRQRTLGRLALDEPFPVLNGRLRHHTFTLPQGFYPSRCGESKESAAAVSNVAGRLRLSDR